MSAKHIPQHIKTGSAALPAISGHNGAPLVVPIAELERTAILGAMKKFGTTTEGKDKLRMPWESAKQLCIEK